MRKQTSQAAKEREGETDAIINSPREMGCNLALEMLLINEWGGEKTQQEKSLGN